MPERGKVHETVKSNWTRILIRAMGLLLRLVLYGVLAVGTVVTGLGIALIWSGVLVL
jgi:hypothetical protein